MKKLVLASTLILCLTVGAANAQPCPLEGQKPTPKMEQKCQKPPMSPEMKAKMEQRKAEFDKKLNLTDEQKTKAEQIRKDGFEKMKPVMDKIKVKKDEIRAIRENGSLTQAEAKTKIDALHKDIMDLKAQAREIRKQNMQDFESILTDKQKKTLEKMKQEGKKEIAKNHKGKRGPQGKPMPPKHPDVQNPAK